MKIKSYSEFMSHESINSLCYGHEKLSHRLTYINGSDIISALQSNGQLQRLLSMPNPLNSSQKTVSELEEMISIQSTLDESDLEFIQAAEDDMLKLIADHMHSLNIEGDHLDVMNMLVDFTDPLLFLLKNHYNRPRPHQLAKALGLEMYPVISTSAGSAAYPSGHSLDSMNIGYVMAKLHPDHADRILDFCHRVAETRIAAGVHYRSDHEFSQYLSKFMIDQGILSPDKFIK